MTAALNTKVERTAEAIENMMLAAIAKAVADYDKDKEKIHIANETALAARREVADALREFLQPTLRVVK